VITTTLRDELVPKILAFQKKGVSNELILERLTPCLRDEKQVPDAEQVAAELMEYAADQALFGEQPAAVDGTPVAPVANIEQDACAVAAKHDGVRRSDLSFFESIATPLIERHWRVAPCLPKSKTVDGSLVPDPLNQRSTDPHQIHEWGVRSPNANVCVYAVQEEGGLLFLDKDGAESIRQKYEQESGKKFPATLLVQSSVVPDDKGGTISKGHWYFLQTARTIAMQNNIAEGKTGGLFSLRLHNQYVASIGSIHPETGLPYIIVEDNPVVPMPDDFLDWLIGCANKCSNVGDWTKEKPEDWMGDPFIHHSMDSQIVRFIGHYIGRTTGSITNPKEMFRLITGHIEDNGAFEIDGKTPFNWNEDVIREKCELKCREWESGESKKAKATLQMPSSCAAPQDAPANASFEAQSEVVEQYAMTPEEIELELEKDYPVIPYVEQAGPVWDDSIMYGLAGDIIRKASAHCESHPSGMYLDLLIAFGNAIGRCAFFNINQTRHYTNEFMARVGLTSYSRKGTGRDVVDEVLKMADSPWFFSQIKSGFGSAESIINEIRDGSQQQVKNRKNQFDTVMVPGKSDKRMCIREGELASVFQLAGKKDSRVDIVLRDGWDGKPLHNLVKGRSEGLSNSNSCREPHISISGDTTPSELKQKMPPGATENGFGNRFLYCFVYRTKCCPMGGPQIDWSVEMLKLHNAIESAKQVGVVGLAKAAESSWKNMYLQMDQVKNRLPGLAGQMTARKDAHIRRLALIIALLDECSVVETWHLRAAKKIWDYCEDSARFIFAGSTADQDKIITYIKSQKDGCTLGEIRREVFSDNKKADWVKVQVAFIVKNGYGQVVQQGERFVVRLAAG